jgi:hypothetical protein
LKEQVSGHSMLCAFVSSSHSFLSLWCSSTKGRSESCRVMRCASGHDSSGTCLGQIDGSDRLHDGAQPRTRRLSKFLLLAVFAFLSDFGQSKQRAPEGVGKLFPTFGKPDECLCLCQGASKLAFGEPGIEARLTNQNLHFSRIEASFSRALGRLDNRGFR